MAKRFSNFPYLNPLAVIALERYLHEIEAGPFFSRLRNDVLPTLIRELLRIEREERE